MRRTFGELAAQGFARVLQGVCDEPGLCAAFGNADFDFAFGAQRQRLDEHIVALNRVREQDQPRHGLLEVELRDEGIEHLFHAERAVGARVVRAVAPVLAHAEEKHLDAGLPAVLEGPKHVGFLQAFGVDRLIGRHMGECCEPVADDGCLFVFESIGGLRHRAFQLVAHVLALAAQEPDRLIDEFIVIIGRDLVGAGRRAALDLVQHARPRDGLKHAIGTRAQQERTLQHVDGAIDGSRRRERPEIVARA